MQDTQVRCARIARHRHWIPSSCRDLGSRLSLPTGLFGSRGTSRALARASSCHHRTSSDNNGRQAAKLIRPSNLQGLAQPQADLHSLPQCSLGAGKLQLLAQPSRAQHYQSQIDASAATPRCCRPDSTRLQVAVGCKIEQVILRRFARLPVLEHQP